MPNADLIDITLVLDRSGSMQAIAADAIGGFNQFLKEQQATPGQARLTLVQFDTYFETVYEGTLVQQVEPLNDRSFVPRGGTALLDAMGATIQHTGERLAAMPEADRPGQVLFVVLTDGEENSSQYFTRQQVFDMVKHQETTYSWQFIFLAANQDAIRAGQELGVAAGSSMTWAASQAGVSNAFSSLSVATSRFRTSRARRSSDYFSDEERRSVKSS